MPRIPRVFEKRRPAPKFQDTPASAFRGWREKVDNDPQNRACRGNDACVRRETWGAAGARKGLSRPAARQETVLNSGHELHGKMLERLLAILPYRCRVPLRYLRYPRATRRRGTRALAVRVPCADPRDCAQPPPRAEVPAGYPGYPAHYPALAPWNQ